MNCHIWVTDVCHVKTCKDSDNTRGAQLPSSVYLERVNLQRYEIDSNAFLTKAFFFLTFFSLNTFQNDTMLYPTQIKV